MELDIAIQIAFYMLFVALSSLQQTDSANEKQSIVRGLRTVTFSNDLHSLLHELYSTPGIAFRTALAKGQEQASLIHYCLSQLKRIVVIVFSVQLYSLVQTSSCLAQPAIRVVGVPHVVGEYSELKLVYVGQG